MKPLLSDDLITLRPPEPGDLDSMYLWENDTRLWNVGTTSAPFSRAILESYIAGYSADIYAERQLRLVIIDNDSGAQAGCVDLFDFDPVNLRAGVGIIVDPRFRRRGFARHALALLERYCAVRLGMHQLWAAVPADNTPSRAAFAAAGYSVSGRLRSWVRSGASYTDAYIYQLMPLLADRQL